MIGRISYEPSVQGVLAGLPLPAQRVPAGEDAWRRRVSWPVLVRATGLGRLAGGELLLVPASRRDMVLAQMEALAGERVAGLVVAGGDAGRWAEASCCFDLPVACVGANADLNVLRQEIEEFIIRRRRELYDYARRVHSALIDRAIAGSSDSALLETANRCSGRAVALERNGSVLSAGDLGVVDLRDNPAARCAAQKGVDAVDVVTGEEVRGRLLLVRGGSPDEDEILLQTLASALAITLGREPSSIPPTLHALFSGEYVLTQHLGDRAASTVWTAVACTATDRTPAQICQALAAELEVRGVACVPAQTAGAGVVLVSGAGPPAWEAVLRAVSVRLGSGTLRSGSSRSNIGVEGAKRSAAQALSAVERSAGLLTRFEDVEVQVLLHSISGAEEYVWERLGPLLDGRAGSNELMETLRVYLATGRNVAASARILHLHRNTLHYRLQRIRRLLRVDLSDPETVFSLDLALRLHGTDPSSASGYRKRR